VSSMDDLKIDNLSRVRLIARGGSSRVFSALRTTHGDTVAVKVLDLPPNAATRTAVYFERELRSLEGLSEVSGVVSALDSGMTGDGLPYMIMPLLVGGSGADRMGDGAMDWREAADIMVRVATTVQGAHDLGIWHRDIKPANILFTATNDPFVADFGIAKLLDSAGATTENACTPNYAAPEAIEGLHEPTSDVYALAATLAALITGQPPFSDHDGGVLHTMHRVRSESPPDLTPYGCPMQLVELVIRSMHKSPAERPPSPNEFARLLKIAARAEPSGKVATESRRNEFGLQDVIELGVGGSATVYSGLDPEHGRVAIKVLRVAGVKASRRLLREVKALEHLAGESGIARVLRTGTTDRAEPFIVMPLYGNSLQQILDEQGSLHWSVASDFVVSTARTIDVAHQVGVIHADLKPSNILLDGNGKPVVSDFGLARTLDASTSMSTHAAMTPSFAAPELFDGAEHSISSDVYSLGATLSALISGAAPFTTGGEMTPLAMLKKIQNDTPIDLSEHGAPPQVAAVAAKAMSKQPGERYQSANELAEALRMAVAAAGSTVRPPQDVNEVGVAPPTPGSDGIRLKRALVGAGIGVLVLAGSILALANRDNPASIPLTSASAEGVPPTPTTAARSTDRSEPTAAPSPTALPDPAALQVAIAEDFRDEIQRRSLGVSGATERCFAAALMDQENVADLLEAGVDRASTEERLGAALDAQVEEGLPILTTCMTRAELVLAVAASGIPEGLDPSCLVDELGIDRVKQDLAASVETFVSVATSEGQICDTAEPKPTPQPTSTPIPTATPEPTPTATPVPPPPTPVPPRCSSGFAGPVGGICTRTVAAQRSVRDVETRCPSGFTLTPQTTCQRQSAASSSCPAGFTTDTSGQCSQTVPATVTSGCALSATVFGTPGGCYTFVGPDGGSCPAGSVEDSSGLCRKPVADSTTIECSVGVIVNGSSCYVTAPSGGAECSSGVATISANAQSVVCIETAQAEVITEVVYTCASGSVGSPTASNPTCTIERPAQ